MRKSFIFEMGLKALVPILLLGSLVIFWRGHQLPGGGFIGGLVAGATLATHAYGLGASATLRFIRFHPITYVALGLALALVSGILSFLIGSQPFTGLWMNVPLVGHLGTPVLFDFGVYLLVIGFVLVFITETLQEDS